MLHTPRQISDHLRHDIGAMPTQLQAAAKYIIDHPAEFAMDPIRVTADKIGVSTNVLVRLSRRLGFSGFEALRQPFRQALVTDTEPRLDQGWVADLRNRDDLAKSQAAFAQNEINVVTRSLRLLDPDTAKQALECIISARRCYVTATRASYALAYYFHYAGRMAHPNLQLVPRHQGSAIDDLLEAADNDCLVAITVHPYSADTIRSMTFARKRGMKIVLISDSAVIAPNIDPDVTLTVSTRSEHHFSSFSGAMAVLECLLGHLFKAGGKAARDRVDAYRTAREDTGAYWGSNRLPRLHPTSRPPGR